MSSSVVSFACPLSLSNKDCFALCESLIGSLLRGSPSDALRLRCLSESLELFVRDLWVDPDGRHAFMGGIRIMFRLALAGPGLNLRSSQVWGQI